MTLSTRLTTYEAGATHQFTWVSSVAPDAAPLFNITDPTGTLVVSLTANTSADTAYWQLFTMPTSPLGYYLAAWTARKTVNGSSWPFISRDRFAVALTTPVP